MGKILKLIIGTIVSLAFFVGLSFFRSDSRYSSAIAHGKTKAATGNVNGAFLSYGDAIRMKPDRADAYFLRAAAMLKLKSNTKAQMDLNDLIRMRPNFGEAYRLRAVCFRAQGLPEKADEDDANADRLGAPKLIEDPEKVVIP
jgi:Tfp pilus assembly protein PilF